ncbi:trigger factor [Patescibacteria group bacterium]|nr:MAG: trigger factor [Patescibacteria group bacterium]
MKAEITNQTDNQVTLKIAATADQIKHALEHTYDHYRPKVKASGFRAGKAPDNIVAREIGDEAIQAETLEHTMSHAYSDALAEYDVAPIDQPKINLIKWVPYETLEFEATVEVMPSVDLPDYKKIKKAVKPVKIESAKVDEMIEDLRRRVAKRIPALNAAAMGDEVKIDFEGKKEGKIIEGAVSKNYTLKLGSNTFIPGFEEELVGVKVGEGKSFEVTFPKDYHEKSLAGQPVTFKVNVHEVTRLKLPEVNDEFAGEVGPFKTVAELKADIKDQLKAEAEESAKREYENELLDEIAGKVKFKVPEKMATQQLERMKSEISQRLMSSGMTMEQYLEMQGKTQDELEKELRPDAEKRVILSLVLQEVAKAEKLTATEDEIEAELDALRMRYTDPKMQEQLNSHDVRNDIFNHILTTKTIAKLVEYAQKK